MASISSLGIGSGLDLNGLLDQLNAAERGKLQPIQRQIDTQQVKISAYGELQGALSGLQGAAGALNDAALYQSLSTATSGDAVQAAAGRDAAMGQYAIEVERLASAGSLASARLEGVTGLGDVVSAEGGELVLQFAHAGEGQAASVPIAIAAGSTLEDIRDAINAERAGVSASIVFDGEGYRLALMSSETGKDASITGMDWSGVDLAEGVAFSAEEGAGAIAQAGHDALLNVNGIPIVSASNQVEGAIQGVTLTLAAEGSSTVKVEQNTRAVREAVTGFVDAYNALKSTIGRLTAFSGDVESAGHLLGDSAVRSIEARLRGVLSGGVAAEEGGFAMLGDIGITLKLDGTLDVDEKRLDDVIANDQAALSAFLAGDSAGEGLAGRLGDTIAQASGDNGALGGAISGAESRIKSLNERYARMELSIEATISRYRTQFGQLDGMIAQMNQTSDYLFQQFEIMNAQLGRD